MQTDSIASAFKRAQIRHRRQGGNPNRVDDLDQFIDFANPQGDARIAKIVMENPPPCAYKGKIYEIVGFPGFLFAPKALSLPLQLELAYRSVTEFCEPPHATNIDLVDPKGDEDVDPDKRIWDIWKNPTSSGDKKPYRSFQKLSWATSGYQYDWTARAYHEDSKSPVPDLLAQVAEPFAITSLFLEKAPSLDFTPSACIVNYYNEKSVMGGHRDDLELALNKPVISLSLGLPGVFLLGGKSKDDNNVLPLLVRPGDVYILGGDCRLNVHGMARVIPQSVHLPDDAANARKPSLDSLQGGDDTNITSTTRASEMDMDRLEEFLRHYRININVRQVLPDGIETIPEASTTERSTAA